MIRKLVEVVSVLMIGSVVANVFGSGAGLLYLVGIALLVATGLWKQPIAMIGAISIAYHECIKDRRTGVCQECGRLNHATSDLCVCGGEVEENDHPEEVLGEEAN